MLANIFDEKINPLQSSKVPGYFMRCLANNLCLSQGLRTGIKVNRRYLQANGIGKDLKTCIGILLVIVSRREAMKQKNRAVPIAVK